jgi:prepilin-type N-terminal cleavage/methylation domain-containing protein
MNASRRSGSFTLGFTLIELLVVIAIIGLLASIILASLNTARQKGRDARRVADLKEIQLALELYYDANSGYPTSLQPLAPSFISALPTDPSSSVICTTGTQAGCYDYVPLTGLATSGCGAYHLGTSLEVNDPSTLDEDADGSTGGTYGTGTADGSVCAGASNNNSNNDFTVTGAGTSGKCIAGDAGSYCYDVKP